MKFLKENKKVIFAFFLGAFMFSSVTAYAAIVVAANQVSLSSTKTTTTTVQASLDELYGKVTAGDATADQILLNKKALVGGKTVTGTMANNGATGKILNPGDSYTIPAGYTTGGTCTVTANTGTYTFATGATGAIIDLGASNAYRYVDASSVYTTGYNAGASSSTLNFSTKEVLIDGANVYAQTYTFTKAYKFVFVHFQGGYSNNGKNCDMSYNGTKATAIYGSTTKTYLLQNVKVGDTLYFDVEGAYPGYATVYGY